LRVKEVHQKKPAEAKIARKMGTKLAPEKVTQEPFSSTVAS
jgi:hypothetical protein